MARLARLVVPFAFAVALAEAAIALAWTSGHGSAQSTAAASAQPWQPSTPVRREIGFTPPPAGSYRLERIMQAPDGRVLDSDGSNHSLREFTTGKITLFSLIYTYCTDAKGCPLAYATLHALHTMLAGDPSLRGQVRFVSMSFDPEFDTPAMMRSYGGADAVGAERSGRAPWHFLTTASARELRPILDGFGQDVAVAAHPAGVRPPVLSHLLKVYLIDQGGNVREMYSTAFLHPAVLYNDIATLLLEERHRKAAIHVSTAALARPGQLRGEPDRNASEYRPSTPGSPTAAGLTPGPGPSGR